MLVKWTNKFIIVGASFSAFQQMRHISEAVNCQKHNITYSVYFEWEKIEIDLICKKKICIWMFLKKLISFVIFYGFITMYLKSYLNCKNLIGINLILKYKYKLNQINFIFSYSKQLSSIF